MAEDQSSNERERIRRENVRPKNDEYSKKLRHVRWQKMRLKVFERDEWQCQGCFAGQEGVTLNVHHCYYIKDKDPWDYPMEALTTLCDECHEKEGFERRQVEQDLLKVLREKGLLIGDLGWLTSHLKCAEYVDSPSMVMFAFGWTLGNPNLQKLLLDLVKEHM